MQMCMQCVFIENFAEQSAGHNSSFAKQLAQHFLQVFLHFLATFFLLHFPFFFCFLHFFLDQMSEHALVVVVVGVVGVVGGPTVGGEPLGFNFRNPIAPPNVSLSTKTITSPLFGSTAKYSPALLPPLSP